MGMMRLNLLSASCFFFTEFAFAFRTKFATFPYFAFRASPPINWIRLSSKNFIGAESHLVSEKVQFYFPEVTLNCVFSDLFSRNAYVTRLQIPKMQKTDLFLALGI